MIFSMLNVMAKYGVLFLIKNILVIYCASSMEARVFFSSSMNLTIFRSISCSVTVCVRLKYIPVIAFHIFSKQHILQYGVLVCLAFMG